MITSVNDILRDPGPLKNAVYASGYATPDELAHVRQQALAAGWEVGTLRRGRHAGRGEVWRETVGGKYTDRMIQWHPGGGHHGPYPYWKVSTGEGGTVRVGPQFPGP